MTIVFLPPSSSGAASVPDATDSVAGKIRISTVSESNTGTNDTTAMTPLKVQQRIAAALTGGVEYKGAYTGQSLVTALKGDLYVSDGAQTLAGVSLANNDHIIFSQDAANPVTSTMFDVIDNTESDTLDTVTGRGATTSNSVQVGGLNIAGNYALPTADGSAGQILKTDGSGALTFQSLGSMSTQAANSVNISGGSIAGITDLAVADGGTGASNASDARTNLGLVIGTDVAPINAPAFTGNATAVTQSQSDGSTKIATTAYVDTAVSSVSESDTLDTVTGRGATTSNSVQVGGLNIAGNYALPTADGSAGQILKTDGSGALTFQSLGSMSTQAANSVNISGGSIAGITDLAVADGGTGASNASDARINLGVAIGSDVQAYDAQLADVAGLTATNNHVIVGDGSNFTASQLDLNNLSDVAYTAGAGIDNYVLTYDHSASSWGAEASAGSSDTLDTVTGRGATTSNSVQVGGLNIAGNYALPTADGSAGQILKTDGSGALTFQSLGSMSTQAANSVNITGGSIAGITDLAVADGGTGASNASDARINLGVAIGSDVQAYDAQLADVAGLTATNNHVIVGDGSNFTASQLDLNNLSDVAYTAGAGIDNYVLTYDHSSTSWGAEASAGGGSVPSVTVVTQSTTPYPSSGVLSSTGSEQIFIINADTQNVVVNLPAASVAGSGFKYQIKGVNATYDLTLTPASGTIDGNATHSITVENECLTLVSDGSNWFII